MTIWRVYKLGDRYRVGRETDFWMFTWTTWIRYDSDGAIWETTSFVDAERKAAEYNRKDNRWKIVA